MVQAMLHDSDFPDFLWVVALNTATYVHNRTPTRALGGCPPFEVRCSAMPELAHLHTFRAPCAIVKMPEKSKKLDGWAN
jgi:hypothetical protein